MYCEAKKSRLGSYIHSFYKVRRDEKMPSKGETLEYLMDNFSNYPREERLKIFAHISNLDREKMNENC